MRSIQKLAMILVPLAAAALAAPALAEAPPPPHIVGGWSEVPRADLQAEVGPAARFAVSRLPRPHAPLKTIIGAERQVVAGMNYRMIVQLKDGKRWRLVVWSKLDGTMELTSAKRERQPLPEARRAG